MTSSKLTKINDLAAKIFYNPLYIVLCGIITYISWATKESAIGMAVLLIIAAAPLVMTRDILPAMPNLLFNIYCTATSDILDNPKNIYFLVPAFVILTIGIIVHLVLYPIKFKKLKLTIPLLFVSIALAIGGVGVIGLKEYFDSIIFIITLGVLMLFLYVFISLYLCPPKSVNSKRYICHILTVLGVLVFVQGVTAILRTHPESIKSIMRQLVDVGWGNRNSIGITLMMCMSASFYLAYTEKKFAALLHYILPFVEYALIVVMFTRVSVLTGALLLIAAVIYTFVKGSNRSQLIYVLSFLAILIGVYILLKPEEFVEVLNFASNSMHSGTSGRDSLYKESIQLFVAHPIFGVGLGYIGNFFKIPPHGIYWFHSTLFQIMANMGLVGLIAYAIYYIQRGVIMFSNPKQFNMVLAISIIAFEINSMMEVGTFTPFPYMFILIFMTAFIEHNNNRESNYLSPINVNIH